MLDPYRDRSLAQEAGVDPAAVARAFAAARDVLDADGSRDAIEGLPRAVAGEARLRLQADLRESLLEHVAWFCRDPGLREEAPAVVARHRDGVATVLANLPVLLDAPALAIVEARRAELVRMGLPERAAERLAAVRAVAAAPDVVTAAEQAGVPVLEAAKAHFAIDRLLGLHGIVAGIRAVPRGDAHDGVALRRVGLELAASHRRLTATLLERAGSEASALESWTGDHGAATERARQALAALGQAGMNVSKAVVASSIVADLAGARHDAT